MKVFYFLRALWLFIACLYIQVSFSQCPTGWNGTATLKWDNRCYLLSTGNYTGYVTAAMSQSQNFTLGTNSMTIARAAAITANGTNTTVTAVTGSYGSGASASFNGNGTITLTLDTVVANLQFSLYDIDNSQTANVTATDASGNPLNITMAAVQAGILTVGGTATSPTATASATNCTGTGTDYRGIVNVSINGFTPAGTNGVKTVTITIGGTAGDFWLSDLSACVYSAFPTSYYTIAKPYTGQPAYILNNSDAPTASMTDVASGNCRYVFTDKAIGNPYLNSFGYDPYKHFLYYVPDGLATSGVNSTNKTLKKYDFNTLSGLNATMSSGTVSTLIPDITQAPFNIPVFDQGVESGAASFYGSSLYLGIEGANQMVTISGKTGNSGRYCIVWRIDFDASNNPIRASQAFAYPADNGSGTVLHNWSDFSISNGILYDFNSASSGQYNHCDLQSGLIVNTYNNSNPTPGQSGTAWNENVYWISSTSDQIALYNKNGTIGTKSTLAGKASIDWTSTGSGDGSDAFKPPLDYGDAPASYDPPTADPACHDYDSTIKFGTYWNCEFAKKTSADATGDGATDDGLPSPPVYTNGQTSYSANVQVYNHSGAAVTVAGWIDLNSNGVFDPSEGVAVTLSTSSTSLQTVHLSWTGPIIPMGITSVFMRIRVTAATNGMTASNPTGYYSNGEVEDYLIPVSTTLQTNLVSFAAIPMYDRFVQLTWRTAGEMNMQSYIIERSNDATGWDMQQTLPPLNNGSDSDAYVATDPAPLPGISYYRLKMASFSGDYAFSEIAKVSFSNAPFSFTVTPNPFKSTLNLNVAMPKAGAIAVRLIDSYGNTVYAGSYQGSPGNNSISLTGLPEVAKGVYFLEASNGQSTIRNKVLKE